MTYQNTVTVRIFKDILHHLNWGNPAACSVWAFPCGAGGHGDPGWAVRSLGQAVGLVHPTGRFLVCVPNTLPATSSIVPFGHSSG